MIGFDGAAAAAARSYCAKTLLVMMACLFLANCSSSLPPGLTGAFGDKGDPYRHMRELERSERVSGIGAYTGPGFQTEQVTSHGLEKTRLLHNDTTVPGDNVIRYVSFHSLGFQTDLARALEELAPLPYPFEFTIERDLQLSRDAGGTFYYVGIPLEPGVTCVLAIRPVDFVGPELAGDHRTVKVVRNCVNGNLSSALAPILAQPTQNDWYTSYRG